MKKYFESGRSMVEILGVLAVAGVLSIGAVSGYKYGMNKYRANETINELQVRSLGLMPQVSRGEIVELNMEMGDKTSLGYTTNAWINERDPKYFYISLENVPSEICEQILKEEWTAASRIYVGNSEFLGFNTSICGNDTYSPPMDFEFSSDFSMIGEYIEGEDMGGQPVSRDMPQTECDTLEEPLGDTYANCYACDYTGDVYVGNRGVCSEICPNRQIKGEYCINKTCPSDKPLMDNSGNCHACDTTSTVYVDRGQCTEICPNRQRGGYACYNKTCPSDKPLMDNSGNCHACDTTSTVYVGHYGQCSEICSNRIETGYSYCRLTVCPSDKPLMDNDGNCRACNETNSIDIPSGGKCAEVCPNRSLISQTSCAITITCPSDKPLMGSNGTCYACDTTDKVRVGEYAQCESVCSNRQINGEYCYNKCPSDKPLMDWNGNCHACNTTSSVYVGSGQCSEICPNRQNAGSNCINKTCPSDKPLMDDLGNCHVCDTTSSVLVYSGQCSEICPNRQKGGNHCYNKCPSDKPLMDWNGNCHACDTTSQVYVDTEGKCSEICPNRIFLLGGSRMCVLPCPADKPLMDYNGYCEACDVAYPIGVGTNGKCSEICSNRVKTEDGYCALFCPSNKPLMHLTGGCYSCGMKSPIEVGINGECEEICANRTKKGELCYLNEEEEKEE